MLLKAFMAYPARRLHSMNSVYGEKASQLCLEASRELQERRHTPECDPACATPYGAQIRME